MNKNYLEEIRTSSTQRAKLEIAEHEVMSYKKTIKEQDDKIKEQQNEIQKLKIDLENGKKRNVIQDDPVNDKYHPIKKRCINPNNYTNVKMTKAYQTYMMRNGRPTLKIIEVFDIEINGILKETISKTDLNNRYGINESNFEKYYHRDFKNGKEFEITTFQNTKKSLFFQKIISLQNTLNIKHIQKDRT